MFSCTNNLQFLAPLMGFALTGHSNQTFHQLFTIHRLTTYNLNFSYRPINIQRPMRMYQPYGIRGCKTGVNVFPTIVCADFETAIHNAVTTVWPGLEFKTCRFHLGQSWWRKIQSLVLSKQYRKKDSEVSQFLKKNIRTVTFTTGGSLRLLCVGIFINLPNDKRVEQSCDYLLENYIHADSTFSLLFGLNVLHHH